MCTQHIGPRFILFLLLGIISVEAISKPDFGTPDYPLVCLENLSNHERIFMPELSCDTLRYGTDQCSTDFLNVPAPDITLVNCNGIASITNSQTIGSNANGIYPLGETDITWTVTDLCGGVSTCTQTVVLRDTIHPNLVCDNDVMGLTNIGLGSMNHDDFVLSATDNCGYVTVSLRKMEDACNIASNLVDGPVVTFCCQEVGDTIMIVVTAEDHYGNQTICMSSVVVQDKIAPALDTRLADVTISCEYDLDLTDLSEFGIYVSDNLSQTTNDIVDPSLGPISIGLDGLVTDACGYTMTTSQTDDGLDCGTGTITRTFNFDSNDETLSVEQTITIQDLSPFVKQDIIWPSDTTLINMCQTTAPDTSITGSPTYRNDACSFVGQSFTDYVYNNTMGGCLYVERHWKLLDWCQYVPNTNSTTGVFEHVQNIELINTIAPLFSNCVDSILVCANEEDCTITDMNLTVQATDNCTAPSALVYGYQIDLDNDGDYDSSGVGNTATGPFPVGEHSIFWTVNDQCGNSSNCRQIFTVQDCKDPTVVCLNGLSTNLSLMVGKIQVMAWAVDFNQSSYDNCTPQEDLVYSFSSDPADDMMTFTCETVDSTVSVSIWATDLNGNQSSCQTYIYITDIFELCEDDIKSDERLSGRIYSEDHTMLNNVKVSISSQNMEESVMTNEDGSYAFEDILTNEDYMLLPQKEDNYLQGVSTLDMVLIQQHILGINELNSPLKKIAADVNQSKSISASDLILIRKLILGQISAFPDVSAWRMIPSRYNFNENNIYDFEEYIEILNLNNEYNQLDFFGVKMGDVNYAIEENSKEEVESRSQKQLSIQFESLDGGVILKTVNSTNTSINGIQFSILLEDEKVELNSTLPGFSKSNYSINDNVLTVSWIGTKAFELNPNEPLFYFVGPTKDKLQLNQLSVLNNEVYNSNNEPLELVLLQTGSKEDFKVLPSRPNPFKDYTDIPFECGNSCNLTIKITDSYGRVLFEEVKSYGVGEHIYRVVTDQIESQQGVYFVQFITENVSITQPILHLRS